MGTYGRGGLNQAPYYAGGQGAANLPGNVKPGPPGMRKGARENARGVQQNDPNAPHRIKAKIIEVHPHKAQVQAISVLKD